MTPDLLAEFGAAMQELEAVREALDQDGPGYLRQLMQAGHHVRPGTPRRPQSLSPMVAKVVREIADDALVRAAARRPL